MIRTRAFYTLCSLSLALCMIPLSGVLATTETNNTPNPTSLGESTILYVGGSGPGNYTRIQDAIDNASTGDTVYVYDDSSPYLETLTINTTLSLIGENQNTTVINTTGDDYKTMVTINASDVRLSGFTIVVHGDPAVKVLANHTVITNLTIHPGFSGWSGTGIRLFKARYADVSDTIIRNTFTAISLTDAAHTTVSHNIIIDPYDSGITVFSSNSTISENSIIINYDPYVRPDGIHLDGSDNYIFNNSVKAMVGNATGGISLWESTGNVIEANTLFHTGFECYKSEANTFINNTVNYLPFVFLVGQSDQVIDDAGQVILVNCTRMTIQNLTLSHTHYGIYLYGTTDSVIQNCLISSCWYGTYLDTAQANTIQNTTIANSDYGIYVNRGSANSIENCTITHSGYNGLLISSKNTIVSHNQINASAIGISVSGCRHCTVQMNTIQNCSWGVYLELTLADTVTQNNLINNTLDAAFYTAILNHWTNNYWGRPRTLPKIIPGMILVFESSFPYYRPTIIIPWMNVDWHPATHPY